MKFKVVPPVPDSLDRLRAVHDAVPLVPDPVESCCDRLVRDAGVEDADVAREWLTFLRALGLAEAGDRGYSRVRDDPGRETLAERFRDRVYAAAEVVEVLADADDPLTVDDVFARVRERVPSWERERSADWEAVWRERVARILGWTALFGLAEEPNDEYFAARENAHV